MSTEAATANNAAESDPLRTVADAMHTAVAAVREGAADARENAAEVGPAVGRFLSRFVYTTSYTLSYGVVFPTMLVIGAVPKDNALVHGLVDGGRAARDMVQQMKGRKDEDESDEESEAGDAEGNQDGDEHVASGTQPKGRQATKKHARGKPAH